MNRHFVHCREVDNLDPLFRGYSPLYTWLWKGSTVHRAVEGFHCTQGCGRVPLYTGLWKGSTVHRAVEGFHCTQGCGRVPLYTGLWKGSTVHRAVEEFHCTQGCGRGISHPLATAYVHALLAN